MSSGFPQERDVEGFKKKLQQLIDADEETAELRNMVLAVLILLVLVVASILVFSLLKTDKGSFA
jgi:hypothetical protein